MAVTLRSAKLDLLFSVTLQQAIGTAAPQASQPFGLRSGTPNFTDFTRRLTNGKGAKQATNLWHDRRSLDAGVSEDLNLAGGTALNNGTGVNTALANAAGVTLGFTRVVWFLCRIVSPAAGKRLLLGNADTTPWLAWFDGNLDGREEVRVWTLRCNDYDGWPVTNASAILRVKNAGSVTTVYDLAIVGSP